METWRHWAATPGGAENLPLVVWVAVDVLEHPAACPGPPIEISAEERDQLRLELAHRVVAGQATAADAGSRFQAFSLLHAQIPPAQREPYLPVLVESLGDPFWLHRAGGLRLLLEIREGRQIRDPVPWAELGEVAPESATAAEVEDCRKRWSWWLDERRLGGTEPARRAP